MERLIFHVDVNSAFLSWEATRRVQNGEPDIRSIPSCISGDPDKRTSVVLAKSIPAKRYGIKTGEPLSAALRKCPELYVAKPDFKLYTRLSKAFKDICRQYAPEVEEFSIDECFLDMTGTEIIYPEPIKTAYEIKDKIRDTLGFTVNVGIGSNKLLAKMASDFEKPDKVHTLFKDEIPRKLWTLPVSDLIMAGRSAVDKLGRAGIYTIGELANTDLTRVQRILGVKLGELLHNYANGIDDSPVSGETSAAKGYSVSKTFNENITCTEDANRVLLSLADSVAMRMRRDNAKAACVSVKIRSDKFKNKSHQQNLPEATDVTSQIYEISKQLFSEMWDKRTPLRLIGIALTKIVYDEPEQLSLFVDEKKERGKKIDKAVDDLRNKFGFNTIKRGSVINSDIDVAKKYKAQMEE